MNWTCKTQFDGIHRATYSPNHFFIFLFGLHESFLLPFVCFVIPFLLCVHALKVGSVVYRTISCKSKEEDKTK